MSSSPPEIPDFDAEASDDPQARPTESPDQKETAHDSPEGRTFPCEQCGADVVFHIGAQNLKCPYCGHEKNIELSEDQSVEEQDFHAMIVRLRELRQSREYEVQESGLSEIRCDACGGTVVFQGTLTSTECPYCATPVQLENVHDAEHRVPVDGVLPFQVDEKKARQNLKSWVMSRWFAPNDFKKKGVDGKFSGVYLPYWTYDAMTANQYSGQRGENYTVTVGTGDNKRTETRTRWYPASGFFQRFFDDVLIVAAKGVSKKLIDKLQPWPLQKCIPFTQQALAGYLAKTYDVELDVGFKFARKLIDKAIDREVRSRIGGDKQRVHNIKTQYDAITFKHLLLPVWIMAYKYNDKVYQVLVNAGTGEVQGERPYSVWKILLTILAVIAVFGLGAVAINLAGG